MKMIALLAVLLFSLAGGSKSVTDKFIFTGMKAKDLIKTCSRNAPEDVIGFWRPSDADVRKLEAKFDSCLSHKSLEPLKRYNRQYTGLVRKGERVVYLNAVLKSDAGPGFKIDEPEMICDGGSVTFGVEFNPSNECFSSFEFNGGFDDSSEGEVRNKCSNRSSK